MAEQQNEKPRPMVGVSVLIMNGDRVLLEQRSKDPMTGAWKAPGGHMEFGESPEQTALREVEEEVGVKISDLRFRALTNDVFEAERKHYITIWLQAKYVSGEAKVKAPYEERDVRWFTWDSLPEPLYLDLQHLLEGKTYPSQTTRDKIGEAIETTPILPGARSEALGE